MLRLQVRIPPPKVPPIALVVLGEQIPTVITESALSLAVAIIITTTTTTTASGNATFRSRKINENSLPKSCKVL